MLAVGKPPAALIVGGAVRVADVAVGVDGTELHPVLVLEGIACIASVALHVKLITVLSIHHAELLVLGPPALSVDVTDVHPQRGTVVARKAM